MQDLPVGEDAPLVDLLACGRDPTPTPLSTAARSAPDFDVDLVYTWVAEPTAEDLDHINSVVCQASSQAEPGMSIQRFRDMGTFRYSLRSAHRFLPWVRRIFLVAERVKALLVTTQVLTF